MTQENEQLLGQEDLPTILRLLGRSLREARGCLHVDIATVEKTLTEAEAFHHEALTILEGIDTPRAGRRLSRNQLLALELITHAYVSSNETRGMSNVEIAKSDTNKMDESGASKACTALLALGLVGRRKLGPAHGRCGHFEYIPSRLSLESTECK